MSLKVYTLSEAREKLGGMPNTSFRRLVQLGKIRKVIPPDKKHGFYVQEDVDKYAETLAAFTEVYSTSDRFEFGPAKNEKDIKATVQIAKQNFGEIAHNLENRLTWFRIAPEGDFVLKDNGVIVGYLSLQNIKKGAIENHIFKPNVDRIRTEDIIPFSRKEANECYVTSIATTLQTGQQHNRLYGALILMHMPDALINLAEQGIFISKIWAKSRTVTGIRLCREIGFEELDYIDYEQIGFVLDVATATNPLITKYREKVEDIRKAKKR